MKKAIVMHVPVIHQGYLNMLKMYGSAFIPVFLLGDSIFEQLKKNHQTIIDPIKRDMRALCVKDTAHSLGHLYEGFTSILEHENLNTLWEYDQIIFSEDEISHAFALEYEGYIRSTQFVSWFLRWNMPASTTRNDIECDRTVSIEELKKLGLFKYMRHAREQSEKSPDWWRQVGSVLVRDTYVLLTACNTHLPTVYEVYYSGDPRSNFNAGEHIEVSKAIHSEASIIAQAGKYGVKTQGCELFVTTFPCPACANLIALSGIVRVYFAQGYSLVGAIDVLRAYGVEVVRVQS